MAACLGPVATCGHMPAQLPTSAVCRRSPASTPGAGWLYTRLSRTWRLHLARHQLPVAQAGAKSAWYCSPLHRPLTLPLTPIQVAGAGWLATAATHAINVQVGSDSWFHAACQQRCSSRVHRLHLHSAASSP